VFHAWLPSAENGQPLSKTKKNEVHRKEKD